MRPESQRWGDVPENGGRGHQPRSLGASRHYKGRKQIVPCKLWQECGPPDIGFQPSDLQNSSKVSLCHLKPLVCGDLLQQLWETLTHFMWFCSDHLLFGAQNQSSGHTGLLGWGSSARLCEGSLPGSGPPAPSLILAAPTWVGMAEFSTTKRAGDIHGLGPKPDARVWREGRWADRGPTWRQVDANICSLEWDAKVKMQLGSGMQMYNHQEDSQPWTCYKCCRFKKKQN